MNPEEIKSTNETQEEIKIPEAKAEAPLTIEQLEAQVSELQAKLEEMKKTNQGTAQAETARIDDAVKELGVGNPEETVAAKKEVENIETEKQEAISEAEEKMNSAHGEGQPLTPEQAEQNKSEEKPDEKERRNEEKIEDNPRFQELRSVYGEMNGPGSHNPEVQKRWAELSGGIAANLNNISDIKEAHFYLANKDRTPMDNKWDELSRQEVESATSEEEMKRAMQNIRPGGYAEPNKLWDYAFEKFPSLRRR